jgi:hypothetical protein
MKKLIDIIELTCRLSNDRIEELVEANEFSYEEIYIDSEAEMKYTELGQSKFNEYYDYYRKTIEDCEVNFDEHYVALKGGIKHYAIDIDIIIDEELIPIRKYEFENLKDANDFYDKAKSDKKIVGSYLNESFEQVKGEFEIVNIQLLRIFNNGEFDAVKTKTI